ncbi:MAG TPA: caspase family protein [Thermoanaerobaculia bacterium]|nr:caspase family protein [Thermoanaerobaculia bacterium]
MKQALIVTISDYSSLGSGNDLAGPPNDAEVWHDVLEKSGFEVHRLADSTATKERFIDTAQRLSAVPDSNNVIVFSGHGTRLRIPGHPVADGLVMFKPADKDITNYTSYVIFDFEFPRFISRIAERAKVTLILDCCFAAATVRLPITAIMAQQALAVSANARITTPRFISLPDSRAEDAPPENSLFALNFRVPVLAPPAQAAAIQSAAAPDAPKSELLIDGYRYVLSDKPAVPDKPPVPPTGLIDLGMPLGQQMLAFTPGSEPMVIAAAGLNQSAFEDNTVDGGKSYGVFSFFAAQALGRNSKLAATLLCDLVNSDINALLGGQASLCPTRSGREEKSFLL